MPRSALLAAHLTALPPAPAVLGAAADSDPVVFEPPFPAEAQLQDNWCWAAVTTGILHGYNKELAKSQCDIAGEVLGGHATPLPCCPPGSNPGADVPVGIDQALISFHAFRGRANVMPPDFQSEIVGELNAGRPLVAQFHFGPDRPDHVVVISGYEFGAEGDFIRVDDPAPKDIGNRAVWAYADFFAAFPVNEIFRTTG